MRISRNRLLELFGRFQDIRIAVCGDLFLDRIWLVRVLG